MVSRRVDRPTVAVLLLFNLALLAHMLTSLSSIVEKTVN